MRYVIAGLALGVGLLSGCSDSQAVPTTAGLGGAYDLTLREQYVFVTSSDGNELRVLDLEASPRNFVRAPNPLEPLSIPVLPRPSNLTRDVRYKVEEGRVEEDVPGPFIYARSFGSEEISVVAAEPEYFKELKRLRNLGFVTAFAARGPEAGRTNSLLYYAVQNGPDAMLYRVSLPRPDTLTQETAVTPELLTSVPLTGETVTALLVMPTPLGQEAQDPQPLVIATRSTTGVGGRTFRVEVNNPQPAQLVYDFGAPVRLLATHPRAEVAESDWGQCSFDPSADRPAALPAGQYVYGVLDESFCGGQLDCSGIVAVDASDGTRAKDPANLPMLPISVGGALPTGLTLAAAADVRLPCQNNTSGVWTRPLVGIVPASNGQITLFDARWMRHFDLDPGTLSDSNVEDDYTWGLFDSAGRDKGLTRAAIEGQLTLTVLEGVTQDNTYRLFFQGQLPGLVGLERNDAACPAGSGTCFTAAASAIANVEPGDAIVLEGDSGACLDENGQEVDLVVTGKEPVESPTRLVTASPIPEGCAGLPRFSVRAASAARPFVVFSDSAGYLGRLGPGQSLSVAGRYYSHPTPVLQENPQEIILSVDVIGREVVRGDRYIINTFSRFRPFVFGVDTSSQIANLASYRLPGPAVYTQVGGVDYAYIAYPSADGILQVSLETIVENVFNSSGLATFE